MGVNLHFLLGLRDLAKWSQAVNNATDAHRFFQSCIQTQCLIRSWLDESLAEGSWAQIGFHRSVLALRAGILSMAETRECVTFIKAHILDCFPNRSDAPRLTDPDASNPRLITPYFSHFALAELWEHGEGDFALDQYRKCWGWALGDDRTTWVEVFDTRWSHCHSWSGCPTWQLTRYGLGIRARRDLGVDTYDLQPLDCNVRSMKGTIPLVREGKMRVRAERDGDKGRIEIRSDRPVTLNFAGKARHDITDGEFEW
jgi:hypothetical protein